MKFLDQLIPIRSSIFKPEVYQGWGRTRRYFEGWYFKVLTADEQTALAIIPGIAMAENGEKHAFIQILDGKRRTAQYHTFPADSFQPEKGVFRVAIEGNRFSADHVKLDLPELKGELHFTGNVPWPSRWYSPGIMGPFSFVPFMECYHGIVSMDHSVHGRMIYNDHEVDFDNGRGYIEKDWGRSFPEAYTWMQTNHFSSPAISFKASVAKIPWLGSSFTGFIAGLWFGDRLIRFTTYNGSELRELQISKENVEIILEKKTVLLHAIAHRDHATSLASPILGLMDGRIEESMTSKIDLKLYNLPGKRIIFEGRGRNLALEVAGNISEIVL